MSPAVLFLMAAVSGQPAESLVEANRTEVELLASEYKIRFRMVGSSSASPTRIALTAQRYQSIPALKGRAGIDPTIARQLFPYGFSAGGYESITIKVGSKPCLQTSDLPSHPPYIVSCEAQGRVEIEGVLVIPHRPGPFGHSKSAITLAGHWVPTIESSSQGSELVLTYPQNLRVISSTVHQSLSNGRSRLRLDMPNKASLSLVARPKEMNTSSIADGFAVLTHEELSGFELEALKKTVEGSWALLSEMGFPRPEEALQLVETDMRHDLSRAFRDLILVSERGFRLTPIDAIERFHEIELAETIFTHYFMKVANHSTQTAQVLGAWLQDVYVRTRFERKDDAEDFLGFWRFVPVIDAMLTAPDLPFARAYFRQVAAPDPYREAFHSPFKAEQDGRLIYQKIVDRLGLNRTAELLKRVSQGQGLRYEIEQEIDADFYETWFGPYPELQYRLGQIDTQAETTTIEIIREGEVAAEPVSLRLRDADDREYRLLTPATSKRLRILTTTLSVALDEIVLDPDGRLIETPSASQPSPKWDNRSSPQWRAILNNFALLISATDAAFSTSIDLGFYRRHDPHWRFALSGAMSPDSYRLSGRGTYGFGRSVHVGRLQQWVGMMTFVDALRDDFAGAGTASKGLGARLYYGFDNRRSYWAPNAGQGLRASLTYRHDFEHKNDTLLDTLALSLRGVQQWQFAQAHGLALKFSFDHYLRGTPMPQKLFAIGGRYLLRGFGIDSAFGQSRMLASTEWLHPLIRDLDFNVAYLLWFNAIDGGIFVDLGLLSQDGQWRRETFQESLYLDAGYSFKFYFDWLGVQPAVITMDFGWPILRQSRITDLNIPAIYIGFEQSFFVL